MQVLKTTYTQIRTEKQQNHCRSFQTSLYFSNHNISTAIYNLLTKEQQSPAPFSVS